MFNPLANFGISDPTKVSEMKRYEETENQPVESSSINLSESIPPTNTNVNSSVNSALSGFAGLNDAIANQVKEGSTNKEISKDSSEKSNNDRCTVNPALSGFAGLNQAISNQIKEVETDEDKENRKKVRKLEVAALMNQEINKNDSGKSNTGSQSKSQTTTNTYPLFLYEFPKNNTWLLDRTKLEAKFRPEKVIHFPYVADTEFTNDKKVRIWGQTTRTHITSQIKGIHVDAPKAIYVNPSVEAVINASRKKEGLAPFETCNREGDFIDYLEKVAGLKIQLKPVSTKKELYGKKKFVITEICHFATAEVNMTVRGVLKERTKELQASNGYQRIESNRRLRYITEKNGQEVDYIEMGFLIYIDGHEYSLCKRCIDTGAIHGVASYNDFCKASGWKLTHKDVFSKKEKSKMLETAILRPQDFEDYSLGDLDVYEALEAFNAKWKEVYDCLGVDDKYQPPKLTIGGTVKDLFCACLAHDIGFTGDKWLEEFKDFSDEFLSPNSAGELRKDGKHTSALLAKVEGGRCRNNRPTDVFVARKIKGKYDSVLICDIDISGCYGEGQRNQLYLIGKPEILSFKATNKNNRYPSLREWLESYDVDIKAICEAVQNKDLDAFQSQKVWGELVAGCFQLRVSTFENLKYPQDFFASWFSNTGHGVEIMAKFINKMKCDTELLVVDDIDFDESEGNLKIFNHQIHNAVITSDGLEWIFAIASKRQRNEMLDKIHVLSSMVYPNSSRIDTGNSKTNCQNLVKTTKNWKGETYAERVINPTTGQKTWRIHDGECHAWFGVNLGDLMINELLINRKKAQKRDGKKSPLDLLFKLGVNTLFGDMVSKYFAVANTCVGNNITARARLLCWCMEKGLYGHQSITDGCAFELLKILFSKRDKIDGECVNLHRKSSKLANNNLGLKPLESKKIEGYWEEFDYQVWDSEKNQAVKGKKKFLLGLVVDSVDMKPYLIDDPSHPGCSFPVEPALAWIDESAMTHLRNTFNMVSIFHKDTTSIKVDSNLNVSFEPRKGQFSFETKDVYFEGAFHGSANYLLKNPNGTTIKARGYEVKKAHTSLGFNCNTFMNTNRYNADNSPAKDFLNQLASDPTKLERQEPAIKEGILKVGDYANLTEKYDFLGLEPGDTVRRTLLMTECSLSQFTFKTYDQWKSWNKDQDKTKKKQNQSFEVYFLDNSGKVNMVEMSEAIDLAISADVMKPEAHFNKSRNKARSGNANHPSQNDLEAVKKKLSGF